MTEEQIKQNAEAYAKAKEMQSPRSQDVELDKLMIIEDYIAGARSRDEEIDELKEELSSLQERYDSLFDGFSKRGTKLGELMKENVKLRNPWISFDDDTPPSGSVFLARGELIGNEHTSEYYVLINEDGQYTNDVGKPLNEIKAFNNYIFTHWMPIPESLKGGQL